MSAEQQLIISAEVLVRDQAIDLNHQRVWENTSLSGMDWLDAAYAASAMAYPKFYKMDAAAKLCLLASHYLLSEQKVAERYDPYDAGVLLTNADASLDADHRYLQKLRTAPNPGLFVYTLPNIAIGELCIKNNFKGHHAFFIFDRYDPGFLHSHVRLLMDCGAAAFFVCGWLQAWDDRYEAMLFLVEKANRGQGRPFTRENLNV